MASRNKGKSRNTKQGKTPIAVFVGIGLIAVLVVLVLIQIGRPSSVENPEIGEPLPNDLVRGENADGTPYLGNPDSPVEIILFEDFGCSNCKNFFKETEGALVDEYIRTGDVVLYSHVIAFVNSYSLPGAEAAECAREQGRYWEYRQLLFENQDSLAFTRDNLLKFADLTGMDLNQFRNCFDQGKFKQTILDRTIQAQSSGIRGTPSYEINGSFYEGVLIFDSRDPGNPGLSQVIDSLLQ